MAYIPKLGESGFYKVKAPFDVLIVKDKLYTCQSLRTINDFIAGGEPVYESYYAPLNVAPDYYQEDVANNVAIVGLQAGTGEWAFIPASFIETVPTNNGVKYVPIVLGVSLGLVPDNYNLEGIIEQFNAIVKNSLGIASEIKGVTVGSSKWFTNEEHDLLEGVRKSIINPDNNTLSQIENLTIENAQLKVVLAEYEKIFKMQL